METRERLQHFLESRQVASLNLGDQRTGALREVEARTVTQYLAQTIIDTRAQRDHRQIVKLPRANITDGSSRTLPTPSIITRPPGSWPRKFRVTIRSSLTRRRSIWRVLST